MEHSLSFREHHVCLLNNGTFAFVPASALLFANKQMAISLISVFSAEAQVLFSLFVTYWKTSPVTHLLLMMLAGNAYVYQNRPKPGVVQVTSHCFFVGWMGDGGLKKMPRCPQHLHVCDP